MLSAILFAGFSVSAQVPDVAVCPDVGYYSYVSAGGVVSYILMETNETKGTSIILPVGVKMFDDVTNNPLWLTNYTFGPSVTVLPRLNINASKGYMYYGPYGNPYGYPQTYSGVHPILIESTIGASVKSWKAEYLIMLYGSATDNYGCPNWPYYYGCVQGHLYSPAYTNTLATNNFAVELLERSNTNNVYTRGVDRPVQCAAGAFSVVTLFFNLPLPNQCNADDTSFTNNWPNYPFPCDTTNYPSKFYRLRCDGQLGCQ